MLENGDEVPLPLDDESIFEYEPPEDELSADNEKYSGKFVIRLPKSLHAKLVREAKKEGVSLNTYVMYKLSF